MTNFNSTTARHQSPAIAALSRFTGFVGQVRRNLRNRRDAAALAEMSDHQLADIGLTRDDVHSALAAPYTVDPFIQLGAARRNNIRRA